MILPVSFVAETIVASPKAVKKKHNVEIKPSQEDWVQLFTALDQGKISKDSIPDILKEKKPVKSIIDKFKLMSDAELQAKIRFLADKNKGLPFNALIGKVMAELKGKADGKKIFEMLKKLT